MSTLTATVLSGLAAVRLEAAGLPDGPAAITRTDANGTGAVRLLPGQVPSAGTLIVTDYEAALAGPVTYAVDDASATVALDFPLPVLAAAGRPNLRAHLTAVTGYLEATTASMPVVQILDREDPIVMQAPHQLPTGTLTAWCGSYPDALEVAEVARSGHRCLFRQADYPGMDKYVVFTGSSVLPDTSAGEVRWTVSLPYTAVAVPTGDLLSAAGWDFDALAAAFTTFDDVTAAFTTSDAVTVGP